MNCSSLEEVNFNAINCEYVAPAMMPIFKGCNSLTKINIGNKVEVIPDCFLKEVVGVKSIIIPALVNVIGGNAFSIK